MIKTLRIENFESHEDSTVEFTDGLNLIVGQSNQGKSSIVRAIALVTANRFDKECVRTGCDYCTVEMTTEKGSVKAERGETVNRWTVTKNGCEPAVYKNIGTGMPPDAEEVLGMGERRRGEIAELPNIMFQLEKHYMLSEVDGKKMTSNLLARMMDDAIGIGGMEDLIKSMADDFASAKKQLNAVTSEISELKTQMLDDTIYASIEKGVAGLGKTLADTEEIQRLLDASEGLGRRAECIGGRLEKIKGLEASYGAFTRVLTDFEGRLHKYTLLSRLCEKTRFLARLSGACRSCGELVSAYDSAAVLFHRLMLLEKASGVARALSAISVSDCIQPIVNAYDGFAGKAKKIAEGEVMLKTAREVYVKIRRKERELAEGEGILAEKLERLEAMKAELGRCPLCGQVFGECKEGL